MSSNIYTGDPQVKNMRTISGYDRLDLNDEVIHDMNVYRHWGGFALRDEPAVQVWTRQTSGGTTEYYIPEVKDGDKIVEPEVVIKDPEQIFYTRADGTDKKKAPRYGVRSLFNYMYAVHDTPNYSLHTNTPILDTQKIRDVMKTYADCSIKALVDATRNGQMGMATYDYSDFMYCKHLGQVSNNYLITLRRFPYPAGDHINYTLHGTDPAEAGSADKEGANSHMYDVGRLVTWMGTPGNKLEEILKYRVLMPYKELNSTIESGGGGDSEQGGLMGTILNMTSSSYAHKVYKGQTGSQTLTHLQTLAGRPGWRQSPLGYMGSRGLLAAPPHTPSNNIDRNKNYGPVDVITKTHMRTPAQEGGIEFDQEISLVFDYELRSYDGINTRSAFLDLIGNILAVTYTNAKFWKGMYSGSGVSQSKLFSNLPIYNLDIMNASFSEIGDACLGTISMIGQALNGGKPVTGKEDFLNMIGNLAKNLLGVLVGGALNKLGRPQRQGVNSLLSDAPVGLWHLTIGNPKHPIMSMGNLILTDVNIQHYGNLGLDDFPTGLKVEIKLKHAMPKDASGIEQMYMMGDFRIYQPMDEDIARIYNGAGSQKMKKNSGQTWWDELNATIKEGGEKVDAFFKKHAPHLVGVYNKTADAIKDSPVTAKAKKATQEIKSSTTSWAQERWRRAGVQWHRVKAATIGVSEGTWGYQKATKKTT